MKHNTTISAERIVDEAARDVHTCATVRPCAYPALEAEVYASLDFICDRVTELPPPSEGM